MVDTHKMPILLWVLLVVSCVQLTIATTTTRAAANTTTPPTTTTPPSTLSPEQQYRLDCTRDFLLWTPNNTACLHKTIDKECYDYEMMESNRYLNCKALLNYEISNKISRYNSMFFYSYLRFFGQRLLTEFYAHREGDARLKVTQTQRKLRLVYSNMIWITGFQFRYADQKWPQYLTKPLKRKWNRRNDTIKVPYGALPRGEYKYQFAVYDGMWTNKLTRELVRLKRSWDEQHIIYDGEYVSYDTERHLYYKSTQVVNSAVLQLYVTKVPSNPLPTRLTIVLNHLDRNMESPVCVYWQQINDYTEELVPPKGYWSNYGMEVQFTNRTMTICRASHYGAFAVLMEPILPPVEKPMTTVDILTIIFSLIAMVMLIGFVVAMGMLECYQSMQNRIYIAVAVSLFFADLFYFVGIFARGNYGTCTNLMTLYELTFMLVVTWCMIDSIHQLNMITPLFNDKTNTDAFYTIIGLGLPLAVLIAMLEFPYQDFEELTYCWPNVDGGYYLYFIGPLGVVILVTGFLRMLTFEKVRRADKRHVDDINYTRAYYGIQSSFVILVTCLIYWIVGAAGIRSERKTGDVIQVILAAIQMVTAGEVLFFFFLKNDEVADSLDTQKRILERMRLNRMDHLAGVIMDVRYVPNSNDASENIPKRTDTTVKNDGDKVNKFDSMFGLNTYAQSQSSSPDSDPDRRNRGQEFTSETSLIR